MVFFFCQYSITKFSKTATRVIRKHFKRLNGALSLAVLRTVTTETAVSRIFTKKEPALEADPYLFIALQYEEECERLFIVVKFKTADD